MKTKFLICILGICTLLSVAGCGEQVALPSEQENESAAFETSDREMSGSESLDAEQEYSKNNPSGTSLVPSAGASAADSSENEEISENHGETTNVEESSETSGTNGDVSKQNETSKPNEMSKPGKPAETSEPAETSKPIETSKPNQGNLGGEASKPAEPSEPEESSEPEEPSQPAEPEVWSEEWCRAVEERTLYYINLYRAEEGKDTLTMLPRMREYTQIRAEQLGWSGVNHDPKKMAEAATAIQYGIKIDEWMSDPNKASLIQPFVPEDLVGRGLFYPYGISEAVGQAGSDGEGIDGMARGLAKACRNSKAHWAYVGDAAYDETINKWAGIGVYMNCICIVVCDDFALDYE